MKTKLDTQGYESGGGRSELDVCIFLYVLESLYIYLYAAWSVLDSELKCVVSFIHRYVVIGMIISTRNAAP